MGRNGYPEIFSSSQALEISRQYLLLRTVILQKKVARCPRLGITPREEYAQILLLAI